MARLVDVIELMIKEMLDENNGNATISRSVLAEKANCVPSQITYVLSTRFSPGNGYIVESRRGGGGQITIRRVRHLSKWDYINAAIDAIGDDITQHQSKILLESLMAQGALSSREGMIIMSAISDRTLGRIDTDIRSVVRADVLRNCLLSVMIE